MTPPTPTLTVHDGGRALAAAVSRFNMVAFHWQGSGSLQYRVRFTDGWSPWRAADADAGNIDWVGAATGYQTREIGRVTRVRAYTVWSPVVHEALRRLQTANAPPIIPRLSWGADESIRRAPPQFAPALQAAFVHHTAGTNDYTPDQSAAIVRGIEIYHVQGNGWNDIGYNFLVDKYGQIFEGRYGGVDKNVIGAHTEGFNTGTVGISMIGQYDSTKISPAAAKALEQLLAWRLDLAHIDPLSTLTYRSNGNPRFPVGTPVDLRAISGHRDGYFTDCPGNALYAQLPAIAKAVASLGGEKIYAPAATKLDETDTRFTARLSAPGPWTVTVTSSAGVQVAQGAGSGSTIDWTWDATTTPPDKYTWTIAAGTARSATGALGATTALTLQRVAASPQLLAPGDTTTIAYTLTAPATVTATLLGPTGQTLAALLTAQKPAGAQTLSFTPPPGLFNGAYVVALTATAGAKAVTANASFTIDDMIMSFTANASSGTIELSRVPLSAALQAGTHAPPVALVAGPQTVTWPTLAKGGTYPVALTITDELGTFTRTIVVDLQPPAIQAVSYANLRFRVSEAATLVLTVGRTQYHRVVPKAATTQFWLKTKPTAYTLTATDAAGNVSTLRYRR
jgi:hypothetical protein